MASATGSRASGETSRSRVAPCAVCDAELLEQHAIDLVARLDATPPNLDDYPRVPTSTGIKRPQSATLQTCIEVAVKSRRPYLTLLLLATLAGCEATDSSKIRAALEFGRLAPLPASANHVEVKTSGNMFARVFWLRFSASSGDISTWLAASKGIANGVAAPPAEVTEDCFGNDPAWYRPSDVKHGRLFEIPADQNDTRGWVLIDEDRHDVLICTSHS